MSRYLSMILADRNALSAKKCLEQIQLRERYEAKHGRTYWQWEPAAKSAFTRAEKLLDAKYDPLFHVLWRETCAAEQQWSRRQWLGYEDPAVLGMVEHTS